MEAEEVERGELAGEHPVVRFEDDEGEAIEGNLVAGEEIALRAYEIHESGDSGDELENWLRAEQELSDRYLVVT